MEFDVVIGLETHVQLRTKSKVFTYSSTAFGDDPNSNVDPITLGLPGALPLVNKQVITYAIMLGLATKSEIRRYSRFARKHYFYPDLPKGYQISQYDEPILEHGSLTLKSGKSIGITRIHIEEDAGKNIHDLGSRSSLIDLNRAGVPLLEVVSEPEITSAEEASDYLRSLRRLVRYLGISDGNMEEGSLRADVNISLKPKGSSKLGIRNEIKNVNSFRYVEQAIASEISRQREIYLSGGTIYQETRLFDASSGTTRVLRGKEDAADYRYMTDPDLMPIVITEAMIEEQKRNLPDLPDACEEWLTDLGLSTYDVAQLTEEKAFYYYFKDAYAQSQNAKLTANWILSELFAVLKNDNLDIADSPIDAKRVGELVALIDQKVISGKIAKNLFEMMIKGEKESPKELVKKLGLEVITDESQLREICARIVNDNLDQVKTYLSGRDRVFGFFVGGVMKETKGKADPNLVNDLLLSEIAKVKDGLEGAE